MPRRSGRDDPDGMRIATVSRLLGVPVPTIRSWERRYEFLRRREPTACTAATAMSSSSSCALRDLVTKGHSTRRCGGTGTERRGGRSGDASPSEPVVDAALALDTGRLRAALDASTERLGVEETIRRAILPAMREIGAQWKAGRCDIGREHFATEGVRAWLARQAFLAPAPSAPTRSSSPAVPRTCIRSGWSRSQ